MSGTDVDGSGPLPDERAFRAAVSRFVTGVTVMTSIDAAGRPHGMTANAVTSVSLSPLLVMVSVARDATMAEVAGLGAGFGLSFLAADQQHLGDRFADPERAYGEPGFDGVETHTAVTGARLLDGAVAWLDCALHAVHDGGDHVLVLGEVRHVALGDLDRGVLLYTPHGYDTWWPGG